RHQERRSEQQPPDGEAVAPAADGARAERRAAKRGGADDPDLELAEPEREQLRRQHHGDDADGERAKRPGGAHASDHGWILTRPPLAFQPEWRLFMYFASKPASRSLIAVLQPTWKPSARYTTTGSDFGSSPIHCGSCSGSRH